MKQTSKIILSLLTILMINGCDENNMKQEEANPTVNKISGVVIDGYISGAKICIDLNNDNVCNHKEPLTITDKLGKYTLDISNLSEEQRREAVIISEGGYDETGKTNFEGQLKSKLISGKSKINLNPMMTIISNNMNDNSEKEFNRKRKDLSDTTGIKEEDINSDILTKKDNKAYEYALKIQKMIEIISTITKNEKNNAIIKNIYSQFNGIKKDIDEIVDEIQDANIIDIKSNLKKMIKTITIPKNITYEQKQKLQYLIEEKKKMLNKLIKEYNSDSLEGKAVKNQALFEEIYSEKEKALDILSDKKEIFVSKLNEFNLSDMISFDTILEKDYIPLLNIDIINISNIEELKMAINNSLLKEIIKKDMLDYIDSVISDKN